MISTLEQDLEFKVIYVGSAETESHDQVLETVMVGPVPVGVSKFLMEAPAPNPALIPDNDVLGVTVVLLTCSYADKEFVRVGYYVNTEYVDEQLKETPPATPEFDKLYRSILADKPRVRSFFIDVQVTRFTIPWDPPSAMPSAVMMDV